MPLAPGNPVIENDLTSGLGQPIGQLQRVRLVFLIFKWNGVSRKLLRHRILGSVPLDWEGDWSMFYRVALLRQVERSKLAAATQKIDFRFPRILFTLLLQSRRALRQ